MKRVVVFSSIISLLLILNASVKSYGADAVTIKGEVIDTFCYSTMGAKGESHRQCAIACVKKGIPAGLLEENTGKVYVLLPNKDKTSLPKAVVDMLGRNATITGKVYVTGGSQFLTVESIK